MVILVVCPFASQLTAVAPETATVDGPVITKSLPLAATELQLTGSAKVNVIVCGMQGGGVTVPIAIGACGETLNEALVPAVTCLLH